MLSTEGKARLAQLAITEADLAARGIRFVFPGCPEWPTTLVDVAEAPVGLFVKGHGDLAELLAGESVAITGSRASTPYGDRVAGGLASGLHEQGCTVVSGLSFGIETAAARSAVAEGAAMVAVLAGGVDVAWPVANAALADWIVAAGGVLVSAALPGQQPTRERFVARGRLAAQLAKAAVLVESANRSGALVVTNTARGLGRPVMAFPGPVSNATSYYPHRLIRAGEATLVTCADDVVAELDRQDAA